MVLLYCGRRPALAIAFVALISSTPSRGDSAYVELFVSANARAVAGLARQGARLTLVDAIYDRAARLVSSGAVSSEEFEVIRTARAVARQDLAIARSKSTQAKIALDLALVFERRGLRVPLCKRHVQRDEDTVSDLLKSVKIQVPKNLPADVVESTPSGSRIDLDELSIELPPPEPPENPPVTEPPLLPPGGTEDPGGGAIDVPEPVEPRPDG